MLIESLLFIAGKLPFRSAGDMSLFDRLIGLVRKRRFHGPWVAVTLGEELDDELLRIVANSGQTAQCRITIRQTAITGLGKERLRSLDAGFQELRVKFAEVSDDPRSFWDDENQALVTELTAASNDPAEWFRGILNCVPCDSDEPDLAIRVECLVRTF